MMSIKSNFFHTKKFQAILWILLCKFTVSLILALVKEVPFPPTQISFMRGLMALIISFGILWMKGQGSTVFTYFRRDPVLQSLRVILGSLGMLAAFYALQHLSLAKVTTLLFSETFLIGILAFFFLKERVSKPRWIAIFMGYLGIWIAIDPVYETFEWAEAAALLSGALLAGVSITAKKLVDKTPPLVLIFYSALAPTLILGSYWLFLPGLHEHFPEFSLWKPVDTSQLGIFLAISLGAMINQFSYLKAYQHEDISFLAPFDYTKFIFSAGLGIYCFGEWPEIATWIGIAFIVLGSLYMHHQEKRETSRNLF